MRGLLQAGGTISGAMYRRSLCPISETIGVSGEGGEWQWASGAAVPGCRVQGAAK